MNSDSKPTFATKDSLPRCPQCKKDITVSISFGKNKEFQPICMPCVTKNLKAKGRKK